MPKVNDTRALAIVTAVRRILVNNPWASTEDVRQALVLNGYHTLQGNAMAHTYVAKIIRKIARERALRSDRVKLSAELAKFEDTIQEANNRLLQIANDPNPMVKRSAKMKAWAQIRDNGVALLRLQMMSGVFDKKPMDFLPVISTELGQEELEAIERAMTRGLLNAPVVKDITDAS